MDPDGAHGDVGRDGRVVAERLGGGPYMVREVRRCDDEVVCVQERHRVYQQGSNAG